MELIRKYPKKHFNRIIASSLMCFMFLNALFSVALAGPEDAQVVNGQVSFQQSGHNTTITASDKAIINYSSFDIACPEVVQFIQPGSSASVLNRILSENPTNINGTLLANGRVFFVNPAGVYIGADARVNVNQLVASSLNITNSDFINGRFNFEGGNGSVTNDGDITAEKVYLIGKQVANSGSIHCPAGYVLMAAGDRVFLSEPDSEIMLEIDPQTLPEQTDLTDSRPGVLNEGSVDAAGGKIVLAAGDIYAQAISNVGSLSASVETGKAGQVKLTADGGQITNTGTIEASGSEGGTVAMEGARIEQFGTVHGDGTDSHGGSVELTASDVAALSSDSLTTANAGTNGDGGEIIVYSPDTALFHNGATIEAKGGSKSGDGGFVEVSGKKHVEIFGQVDASSTNGAAGTFVIDPADITITAAPAVEDIGDDGDGTFTSNTDTNIILDTTIEGYLDAGTNVTLDTSDYDSSGPHAGPGGGDITVSAAIDPSAGLDNGDVTLTLNAAENINVNAAIDGSGLGTNSKLNVELHANRVVANPTDDGNISSGNVSIHDTITTNGGSFTSSGIDFDNTGGTISTNDGNVDIQNTGNVTIGATINTAAGGVDIDGGSSVASNIISSEGIITSSGTITLEASGNIGASRAAIDTASTGTINASSTVAGDIYINNTGAVTLGTVSTAASDIVINNSGDLSINSVTAGGGGEVYLGSTGNITTQILSTTTGDIFVQSSSGDLILSGPVTSGGGISLESTEGKIVFYDSDLGLTPIITDGGSVGLAAREIYSYGNNENAPLGIQGATELFLFDTGPGDIKLAEVDGSTISLTSVTVGDIGYGTIDITYDNERGRVNIGDNHLKSVDQPFSFSYTANKGNINIGSITTATGDISVRSWADLILSGSVKSGGGIELLSTEGKIVFYDLGPGLTPAITAGGAVSLAAGEIYSYGNKENAPLSIQGATELTLFDTGPGSIELAEVNGSTIDSTSITVVNTGYGTIDITYDNGRGRVDIDDNHFINSIDQPFSFSYTANKGDINIGSITTLTGDIFVKSSSGGLMSTGPVTSGGGITLLSSLGNIETQELTATFDILLRSQTDLILSGTVTSGGEIALESTSGNIEAKELTATSDISVWSTGGKIVFYDSGPGLTPIKTDGGAVSLAAGEIYSYGNKENTPLGIQGATELTLNDNGPGDIKLAEVDGSIIDSTSITVGNTGYGTIDITYENERGLVDIDDNHFIKSVVQPSSFSYTAMKGDINIGSITTATGDIFIKSSSGDLISNGPVTSGSGITLLSTEGKIETQQLNATSGNISATSQTDLILNGPATSGGGIALESLYGNIEAKELTTTFDILVRSWTDLILNGLVTASGGGITLESGVGNIETQALTATGDIFVWSSFVGKLPFQFSDLILNGPVTSSGGGITLQGSLGNIEAQALKATGDISVRSLADLILSGPVNSGGGGVKLNASKISTPGEIDDTLNVAITGYSDETKGVNISNSPSLYPGKAAIVIKSQGDLKLGPDAALKANGIYQADVDDRQSIFFKSTGDPIDIAIYVKSPGYVTVDSAVSIYRDGTMVIDTWDKVNDFGYDFKNSWWYNYGKNRLELVSRQIILSEGEAVNPWTLPYAEEAIQGRAPPWFTGLAYVLRWYVTDMSSGLESDILTIINYQAQFVPLPYPFILVLEPPSGSLRMPDDEELMRWLEQEGIAPYFEGAYQATLNTDLRFVKAANQLRDYAAILNETSDAQIEELTEMLDGIVQPGPIALPIAWFDRQLRVNRQRDEVLYAEVGGKWIEALIGFTKILNTQFGWPIDNCIKKVMRDYIVKLKADDHKYFVQKYILSVLGFEDRPIFLASLREVD